MSEQRRLNVRTLAIASVASAAAAAITSQFWIRGTPFAAAVTPIIVALVSELLHRPTDKLAERLTGESNPLPEAAGAAGPPHAGDEPTAPAERDRPLADGGAAAREASGGPGDPDGPGGFGEGGRPGESAAPAGVGPAGGRPEFTVYRSAGRRRRRRIAWVTAIGTGLLAFLIAATVLTVPEAITGQSLFTDRKTTLGGTKRGDDRTPADTTTETSPAEPRTETVTETTTTPAPPADTTAPTTEQPPPATPAPQSVPPSATPPDGSTTVPTE